jgi:phosphoribosylaminoimidazole carboxylase
MLGTSASLLNIPVIILSPGLDAPAKQVLSHPPSSPYAHIDGSFTAPTAIKELAEKVDVLTVEIEHVDVATLEEVQRTHPNLEIHPSPRTIHIIQDKFLQKEHLRSHGLPISQFVRVDDKTSIESATHDLGLPLMLKARTLAYDGRGNHVLQERSEIEEALKALGGRPLYAEKWVPFVKEVAVMVVRSRNGEVQSYPVVETVHRDNICHLVFAGCGGLGRGVEEKARKVAEDAVRTFEGAGVFGVEMFLIDDGKLLYLFLD